MAGVVCCVYNSSCSRCERIKLASFSLSETVDSLKTEISKHMAITKDEIQVISCGKLLNGSDTLESCGVKPGVTVHAVRKSERERSNAAPEKMDTSDVGLQSLVLALKSTVRNPAYRSTVRRLSKPEVWENISAVTPGLASDPIAIAILQDPDLLMQFTDLATMQKAVETHPALAEAIHHVVAAVQEDSGAAASTSSGAAGSASAPARAGLPGFFNLLWDMSDDEDFSQSDQASISDVPRTPQQGERSPFPAITPAQLASALAAVATASDQGGTSSGSQSGTSSALAGRLTAAAGAASSSSSLQSPSIVTPEIFSHAVQQAMSSATAQNQLQQLRDMGITDDAASLRALEITNGDVQAALELIFGGGEGLSDNSGQ